MAKELPYFKFEPGAWDNGKIQVCPAEARALFISLCCMYWQRLGDLPKILAIGKVCNGNATALEPLISAGVIKVVGGDICIDFLNEQLQEFEHTSKQNSDNARSGWKKRRNNATELRPHSDRNAIREEEKREEKILKPEFSKSETTESDWETWGSLIVSAKDAQWEAMRGRQVTRQEMDTFLSVATRCGWQMATQHAFRISLKGFKAKDHEKEPPTLTYQKGRAFGS